jgi:hypothetical protein
MGFMAITVTSTGQNMAIAVPYSTIFHFYRSDHIRAIGPIISR